MRSTSATAAGRLAVVSGSAGDLVAKLRRSADRLADPKVKQVRDVQGVYYFDQPLYAPGALAVLMPGEGAQSVGMLGGLCEHFPEVAYGFEWCDEVAAEAGRPESSLRPLIFPPADATPEELAAAEAKLKQLGPSIFSVLVADLAAHELLKNLRLPVAAYAGHSAGELAALYAAGAIPPGANSSAGLVGTMDLMQRQEEAAGGPEALLLATGAGKPTVEQIVFDLGAADVYVAMDNCPHQSVVVGAAEGVMAVEAELAARGILCERLALRRPYHTPLFAPCMGPFYDLFDRLPVRPPHTPVYSATTGERFPDDPDGIRKLTVDHWKSPVEFTRFVQTMHADGIRLFVECGPRGNLSAFVEDILRGRPFAALPLDTPRRGGVTQLNHIVSQLLAHHVPVEVGHLFANRKVRRFDWRAGEEPNPPSPVPEREGGASGLAVADHLPTSLSPPRFGEGPGEGSPSPAVLNYLAVMEQFLDVQREVMGAWLDGGGSAAELPALDDFLSPPQTEDIPGTEHPAPGTLVSDIVRLDPGREVVVRRRLDLAEDRYVADHTIGGRNASEVDPHQHGLPVLPMTFSLELMAECAELLLPGWTVTALRDIRLMRWLPFEAEPTTVEVTATVQPTDPPTVRAVVRDLAADKPTAEGVVELSQGFPEAPALADFPLTDDRPCKATCEDLYRNLFHGPLFQGIRTLDRYGEEGIEGTVEVLPRHEWFAGTPDPRLVTDPVLVDVCMHILGAWHLEQPDWTGRILLPIGLKRIEFFGPPPEAGTVLKVRGTNEEASRRHFVHGVEAAYSDGRLWCRLTGAGYWRFYLPFGHVNFFGPKDEYFLSRPIPEALPVRSAECGVRNETQDGGGDGPLRTGRCWFLEAPADLLTQPVLRAAGARVTMSARELDEFARLSKELPDAEMNAWLFGRIVGKDAVRSLRTAVHGDRMFPADIELDWDGTSRPTAAPRDPAHPGEMPNLSIAHLDGRVVAAAAFHPHVGVALAKVEGDEAEARRHAAKEAVVAALKRPSSPSPFPEREGGASGLAVADDLPTSLSPPRFGEGPGEGSPSPDAIDFTIAHPDFDEALLVRTLCLDDFIVAVTFCEGAPS